MDKDENAQDEAVETETVDAEPTENGSRPNPTFQAVIVEADIQKLCETLLLCTIYLGFIIAMKRVR